MGAMRADLAEHLSQLMKGSLFSNSVSCLLGASRSGLCCLARMASALSFGASLMVILF